MLSTMASKYPMECSTGYQEQHSVLSLMQFIESLGYFSKIDLPPEDFCCQSISNVNRCLTTCFHQLIPCDITIRTEPSCPICCIVKALVHHFANCIQRENSCSICLQLFRLLQGHVGFCHNNRGRKKDSASDICFVLLEAMDLESFDLKSHMFWVRSKKFVAEIEAVPNSESLSQVLEKEHFSKIPHLNENEVNESDLFEEKCETSTYEVEKIEQLYGDAGCRENLHCEPLISNISQSNIQKKNDVAGVLDSQSLDFRDNSSEISPTELPMFDPNDILSTSLISEKSSGIGAKPKDPVRKKVSRMSSGESKLCELPETQVVEDFKSSANSSMKSNEDKKALEFPTTEIEVGLPPQVKRNLKEYNAFQDSYDTQKTYGESRVTSLPMDPSYRGGDQFSSLEMRPVGQPGVGEVVYGTREQLRLVAHYWSKLKNTLKDTTTLPQQKREEGVILSKHKKQLKILRTLYQKHFQWERLTHLGNGAAGKCHLAKDLNTDFQFCVKRLIIHRYEEQELKIWCDLKHDNIVHLFGALRRGEKIYILAEFIDGGSLTACINAQKSLNRRISHVMALTYLRQLLQVLTYLQSRGILHEDIKSDNILLRAGSTSIAVCDFGLARYINQKKDFKGQSPSGTSTQWSPEKAASHGHGFPAEVWAAFCVLVHMMSGDPPWLKRYHGAAMLHFIIFEKSPPLEDVPDSVRSDMKDFITLGFTRSETIRPTAKQLLSHPIFQHIAQENPERYFSLLTTERPPLVLPSPNSDELNAIVQNLQQKIDQSAKQQNPKSVTSSLQVHSQTITSVVSSGSVSKKIDVCRSLMSQTTHVAPGLDEKHFPMSVPCGENDGNFKGAYSESVQFSKSLVKSAGFGGEVTQSSQPQTISKSQNTIRTSNVMLQQTFNIIPGKNDGQGSSLATEIPSEVSLKFRIKPEIVEASARLTEMPPTSLSKLNSNDLPKLSILEKVSFDDQSKLNSITHPKFSLLASESVGLANQGQGNQTKSHDHDENTETSHYGPKLKSSHSVPDIYSSKTATNFKSCLSAPDELCNVVDIPSPTEPNLVLSELYNKFRSTSSNLQTSSSQFSNNIFPPSISELHNKLNAVPENDSLMPSSTMESSEDTSVEELYEHFLNDSFNPNQVMLQRAPLNEYEKVDNTNGPTSKGSEPVLPNLPIFSQKDWDNGRSVSTQSNHIGNQLTNIVPSNIPEPTGTGIQPTVNSFQPSNNDKPQRSSPNKHKSSLHIDIKQPSQLNVTNLTQTSFKSAPIHQVSHNRKFTSKTAEPGMTGENGLWLSTSARSSMSTRSSELDEERDKLLQEMRLGTDPDFLEQDERSTELVDSDIGLQEQQELITQRLQNNIYEVNGTGILNFYDESQNLICSVKASPTIRDWKELFDASPIIQKIQDKNILHFKIQYKEEGNFVSVDYTTPINKHQTNLTVSPTTPDDNNCWCDSHLSV